MTATVEAIGEAFDFRRLIGVVAVLADKDARGMLELLEPVVDETGRDAELVEPRVAGRRPRRRWPSRSSAPIG